MSGDHDFAAGGGYLWRRITPRQAAAIVAARAAGVTAAQLACEYRVSVRTIYRALALAGERAVTVRVESWQAEYVITDDGPVRMTAWYAVSA